mmetsp:Transcript_9619/g.22090  ORF Transcript_9619/g.22090 Transcript_9619/m.22090 type:complete len:145 (-) Transcript_9619:714-1148(-)
MGEQETSPAVGFEVIEDESEQLLLFPEDNFGEGETGGAALPVPLLAPFTPIVSTSSGRLPPTTAEILAQAKPKEQFISQLEDKLEKLKQKKEPDMLLPVTSEGLDIASAAEQEPEDQPIMESGQLAHIQVKVRSKYTTCHCCCS